MKYLTWVLGFAFIAHVKCQLDVHIEDILYGEDEEDDEEVVTTTRRARRQTTTTTATTVAPVLDVRQLEETINATLAATNLTNSTGAPMRMNHTFVLRPDNGSFFGASIGSSAGAGVTTERVQYVLGQVGNIWNNVGSLNITGIVDQALGIRNSQIARPLVTGILNIVLCNPLTFSNNNCRRGNQ